jgi:hypothetical protein
MSAALIVCCSAISGRSTNSKKKFPSPKIPTYSRMSARALSVS